jgi:FixJ family two-component response regulator
LLRIPCRGELGISEITVKAHRGKVMQKMKADSLADSSEDGG